MTRVERRARRRALSPQRIDEERVKLISERVWAWRMVRSVDRTTAAFLRMREAARHCKWSFKNGTFMPLIKPVTIAQRLARPKR